MMGNAELRLREAQAASALATHDAGLLIGDPALKVDRSQYKTWDLAEEWIRFTGTPFVFAFWAVTQNAAKQSSLDLAAIFQNSRDHGLIPANLACITGVWAPKLGLKEEAVRDYLTTNIHYYLDEACLDGLRLFYRYAHECGVLPSVADLHFAEAKPALI
jgi:chorismate dehydratase